MSEMPEEPVRPEDFYRSLVEAEDAWGNAYRRLHGMTLGDYAEVRSSVLQELGRPVDGPLFGKVRPDEQDRIVNIPDRQLFWWLTAFGVWCASYVVFAAMLGAFTHNHVGSFLEMVVASGCAALNAFAVMYAARKTIESWEGR